MRRTFALLVLISPAAHAQRAITGSVADEQGRAITNAAVRLESLAGSTARTAATDGEGRFSFKDVQASRAIVAVDAPNFERAVREVAPPDGDVKIVLRLRAVSQQITVAASGFAEDLDDAPRAAAVLTREDLDRRMEYTVADALRQAAGVRITQLGGPGASTNIRIRGLRAQDTAVLIDGMRFRDPAATQGDASAFGADFLSLNISRIEVLRGCGSALFGTNAMGGVVNIVSDAGGGKLRADFLAEGGGLGFLHTQARVAGGFRADRFTYSLGLAHVNVLEGVDGDDRSRNSSLQSLAQYRATPKLLLSARLFANNTFLGLNNSPSLSPGAPRTGIVNAIPLSDAENARREQGMPFALGDATVYQSTNDPDSRRAAWLNSALFAADYQPTARLNYRFAYQLVDTHRGFPNGPGGIGFQPRVHDDSNFDGRVDTLQARMNWTAGRQIFNGGFEWERESFDNASVSRGVTAAADSSNRARVSQRSYAVYGEERWRFLRSRLQVTLSGRIQRFDLSLPLLTGGLGPYLAGAVPSPPAAYTGDAAVMYRVEKTGTKLRAHMGNAYRAPSLYERYGTGFFGGAFTPYGDPRLESERSLGGDAGIDQYFGNRRARLSATYFYTQLRSVIGFDFSGLINRTTDPFGRTSGYFNTDGGLARGVEIEGQVAGWRGFGLTGSYTHTRTLERRAIALGTLRTPRIYAHTVSINATQTFRRVTLTGTFFGSPEYLGVISGRAVSWPGPRKLDATAAYKINRGERWKPELFVRSQNLLDQRYFEDGFRTPGRWVTGGIRISY